MKTKGVISKEDHEMLQAHLEALIITMDNLAVKHVEIPARNATKSGARVTLLPMKK
jgi:hypothetical protein